MNSTFRTIISISPTITRDITQATEVHLYGDRITQDMAEAIALAVCLGIPVTAMSEELKKDQSINECLEHFKAIV